MNKSTALIVGASLAGLVSCGDGTPDTEKRSVREAPNAEIVYNSGFEEPSKSITAELDYSRVAVWRRGLAQPIFRRPQHHMKDFLGITAYGGRHEFSKMKPESYRGSMNYGYAHKCLYSGYGYGGDYSRMCTTQRPSAEANDEIRQAYER